MGSSSSSSRPLTRDECFIRSAEMVLRNQRPIFFSSLQKVARATCNVILPNGSGTGFLVSFPISIDDRFIHGLVTNNHVISGTQLQTGCQIKLHFQELKTDILIQIEANTFRFTSPLLDVTFVEILPKTFPELEYLPFSRNDILRKEECFIVQHAGGEDLSMAHGYVRTDWGFDLLHEVSTDYGSSGSAVVNPYGEVIGVHKSRKPEEKCNVATKITNVQIALSTLIPAKHTEPQYTLAPAKCLTQNEISELKEHGLESTWNPDVFISPSSAFVTTLWFLRTNHAWYWTPTKPASFNLEDLKMCNWSLIHSSFPIRAIGGFWDTNRPAQRNIKLIEWLQSSGLSYLS